jgi:hypothetical protein
MSVGAAVERPNGKVYKPRKGLRMIGFDDYIDGDAYVAILGTHDIAAARAAFPGGGFQSPHLVEARLGWVRETIRNGERFWDCDDTVRGAAAVIFRESDDPELSGTPEARQ